MAVTYPWWDYRHENPIGTPDPVNFAGDSSAPHPGVGPFGLVPGAIGDISGIAYNDLLKRLPTLPGMNAQAANSVQSRLAGQLSPETQRAIQDIGARFGLTSGMPGSGLSRFRTARDLGRTTEDLQRAGLQDYGNLLSTVQHTQTVSPETQVQAKEQDLLNAAAPDPAQAASYAEQLFNKYLNSIGRSGRGQRPLGGSGSNYATSPAGGTGAYVGPEANRNYNVPPSVGGYGTLTGDNGFFGSVGDVPTDQLYDPTLSDADQFSRFFPGDTYLPDMPVMAEDQMPLVPGQSYGPWDQDWWT